MHDEFLQNADFFIANRGVPSVLVFEQIISKKPEFSFLIPTFKRPEYLADALSSIAKLSLNIDYEVVVIENDVNSREEFIKTVKQFPSLPLRAYVNEENIGMFGNWNRCIEMSKGEFLTILNDDDVLTPKWGELVKHLEGDAFVSCYATGIKSSSSLKEHNMQISPEILALKTPVEPRLLFLGLWTNGVLGTIFSREAVLKLGGFNAALFPLADWDFYVRYLSGFGGFIVPEPLSCYRWGENEAVNPSTILSQISMGFAFRGRLIEVLNPKRKLVLKWVAKIIMVKGIFRAPSMNTTLDAREISDELGVNYYFSKLAMLVPDRVLKLVVLNYS